MHATIEQKQQIRDEVRVRRAAVTPAAQEAAASLISAHLISLVERAGARSVACYRAMPTEPDTTPFLDWAHSQGIEVLLPVSLPGSLLDWARYEPGALAPGRHKIPEPTGSRLGGTAVMKTDLMIIPACAVDEAGVRLGWGMGYYDRCIAQLPPTVPVYAVVFDEDRYHALPRDPHDAHITGAVSPSAVTTAPSHTR